MTDKINYKNLNRYLDNLSKVALKQVIRVLLEGNKEFVERQINEFNCSFELPKHLNTS